MKFLFIVQGEGRGHLTQALTLEDMLLRNGHEVVEILVGKSSSRSLPGFFNRNARAEIKRFMSPNFLPTPQNKRVKLGRSILYNILKLPEYLHSMLFIKRRIEESGADVVINFYELLTGLTYTFMPPHVPYVCIGHQYLFLHSEFKCPEKRYTDLMLLRFFTRMTSVHCHSRLALSFYNLPDDEENHVTVVPPLLRKEVSYQQSKQEDFILGYMVNAGFAENVHAYHARQPQTQLHFFWDRHDVEDETQVDDTLTFHRIDDVKFINMMSRCKAYASTAGFESICEAMYLGKPVLMVPAHIEQDCNGYDAMRAGAGIVSDTFDMDALQAFAETYRPNKEFVYWTRSCEYRLVSILENLQGSYLVPALS